MSPSGSRPNPSVDEYKAIAKKWTRAQKIKNRHDAKKGKLPDPCQTLTTPESEAQRAASELQKRALKAKKKSAYEKRWWWTASFWMWMLLVHSTGILLFTRGFLLTRLILDKSSECAVPPVAAPALGMGSWKNSGSVDGGCWHPKSFDKAVIILIDALRYDFTVPPSDSTPAQTYHNALTHLHESAVKAPENSFLRPFIADPPTTTLQRLKGLTTGTLPTFIDAGSNFAGTAIEEDNILAQLRKNGKRIAHLGDDTWLSLFPDHFETNISHAYDSFNVWDLHTVDNGVIEHIFPLLKDDQKGQWDVLIGHLLGVDHAGHRYGPEHTAMASKLRQMDKFIREITEKIDDDTLLVVMGDHGMDSKGDHGGESDDEVEAALWMYSKRPFFGRTKPEFVYPPANAKIRPINQIDLVPTLSLLLGIPIPYNNLGGPIEEAFFHLKDKAWDNLATVSHITSAQIHRYQNSYYAARGLDQATSAGSPMSLWEKANAFDSRDVKKIIELFARFQSETLAVCIGVMAAGALVLVTYASKDEDEDFAILENLDLEFAETGFEMSGIGGQEEEIAYKTLNKRLVIIATTTSIPIGGLVFAASMATLSSIQWDAAFIPLMDITAVTVVPLVVLWKVGPKRRGVLESVSSALASFVAFYAIEALATMVWAGHLRRHLMLYRIFSPRFMMAAAVLLVVDFAAILVALIGTRCNTMSIGDAFGWAD
ncbi:GPI ethanolamine phosphate transferase 3 [Ceratocystis platani]|uniref:GPI ethanolamine phosphate transferase 3 n=1 Tax=Ceratocystis fimbriata f. sp. platani TaxID=88771 RepID=A0A0F8D307_CERFI|nr:GPI ethanolamine phosphate transferase 3 [Ceratocystis platani]